MIDLPVDDWKNVKVRVYRQAEVIEGPPYIDLWFDSFARDSDTVMELLVNEEVKLRLSQE